MELEFIKRSVPYLKRIIHEIHTTEETGETVVPDSYPDMGKIIHSYAEPIIRSKDCREGSVTVTGGIRGGLIYSPDDHSQPRKLQFYLPFTVKIDSELIENNAQILCTCTVSSVNSRIINSRKAQLQADLSCDIAAFEPAEIEEYSVQSPPESLQLREKTYTLQLPSEISEKSLEISETLDLPISRPAMQDIYKCQCTLELLDKKLVANKGVFKGNAVIHLLYCSEDGHLYTYEWLLPFSQYCEFQSNYDQDSLELCPIVMGFDPEQDKQDPAHKLHISIQMLVQGIVCGTCTAKVIEDAYCTDAQLLPQWDQRSIECCLDIHKEKKLLQHRFNNIVTEVIDSDIYIGSASLTRAGDHLCAKTPISCHMLFLDENNEPAEMIETADYSQEYALAPNANAAVFSYPVGTVTAIALSGGAEISCELLHHAYFFASQSLQSLCGGTLAEKEGLQESRPSVIMKNVPRGSNLWEIAKSHGAKIEDIRAVNELKDETLSEAQILLIPVG